VKGDKFQDILTGGRCPTPNSRSPCRDLTPFRLISSALRMAGIEIVIPSRGGPLSETKGSGRRLSPVGAKNLTTGRGGICLLNPYSAFNKHMTFDFMGRCFRKFVFSNFKIGNSFIGRKFFITLFNLVHKERLKVLFS